MSEVLVLIDHADGEVKKPTYELLTIARRLGEPSAVFIGSGDQAASVADKVKKYGAAKVYVVDDADLKGYLVAPKAEAMQQLVENASAGGGVAAVLLPSTMEGREIAGRLAIKIGSGLITDAVDVQPGDDSPVTTQTVPWPSRSRCSVSRFTSGYGSNGSSASAPCSRWSTTSR